MPQRNSMWYLYHSYLWIWHFFSSISLSLYSLCTSLEFPCAKNISSKIQFTIKLDSQNCYSGTFDCVVDYYSRAVYTQRQCIYSNQRQLAQLIPKNSLYWREAYIIKRCKEPTRASSFFLVVAVNEPRTRDARCSSQCTGYWRTGGKTRARVCRLLG